MLRTLVSRRLVWRSTRFFTSAAPSKKLTILYGSQTGTAKGFAQQLRKDAKKKKLEAQLFEMNKYETGNISKDGVIVFVASCFGEGEPPDNAKTMYDWVMSDESADHLKSTPYCVFGLGQSKTYPDRYQAVGRALDKRMLECGGEQIVERGEGDDSGDIEEDFEEWCDDFFGAIKDYTPKEADISETSAPEVEAKPVDTISEDVVEKISVSNPHLATLTANYELLSPLAPETSSVVHITFDITGSTIKYTTGDYLGVYPQNDSQLVKKLAVRIGEHLNTTVKMEERHPTAPKRLGLGSNEEDMDVSLKDFLTYYADFVTPPRRAFLRALAEYAEDPLEKEKMLFLTSNSQTGKEDYALWVQAEHRDVLTILNSFPSIKISASQLCAILPTLTNRFYSISSSPKVDPNSVDITVALARHTPASSGMPRTGVCSSYLVNLMEGDKANIFVKESLFRLPSDPNVPVVMIGAGTGVAPFRAFVMERCLDNPKPLDIPNNFLVFGCNNRKEDYLYEGDFRAAVEQGKLQIELACSFEQSWYIFVQHRVREQKNAEIIWKSLNEHGGYLYICGDAKHMAKGVHKALVEVVQRFGDMDEKEAEKYLSNLQAENRYQLDVF